MSKKQIIRGATDYESGFIYYFFFIVKDKSSQAESIIELKVIKENSSWKTMMRQIFDRSSGEILALERDHDVPNYHGHVNFLYLIDSQLNVIYLKESKD